MPNYFSSDNNNYNNNIAEQNKKKTRTKVTETQKCAYRNFVCCYLSQINSLQDIPAPVAYFIFLSRSCSLSILLSVSLCAASGPCRAYRQLLIPPQCKFSLVSPQKQFIMELESNSNGNFTCGRTAAQHKVVKLWGTLFVSLSL